MVVTDTAIGDVRGLEGFYHYRQYSAIELALKASLEDVWYLLIEGSLPGPVEREVFAAELKPQRRIDERLLPALAQIASTGAVPPLDALKSALTLAGALREVKPLFDLSPPQRRADALFACAQTPTLLAALHRLGRGLEPLQPQEGLSYAANYLYMITGQVHRPEHIRAIEQYLISTIDHGFNASTFTARVIASTGADLIACLAGALGALSGPLHGGAPSRALDTLDEIGSPERIDSWVRERILAGDRIMGFGHPIYQTEDPRSRMLKGVAQSLGGPQVDFAVQVEQRVLALLKELKPGRELHTNVEFYAGVVMELCGLPRDMFTPTFACSRVIGWCANILEQAQDSKIIRPSAHYAGLPAPQPVPLSFEPEAAR